ncbi:hypothetical protein B0H11DRAFT_2275351 [Mycena galericulata]|nr:hypothetical protein B0H11DRAFT_2275351 [Mycena galericulata]
MSTTNDATHDFPSPVSEEGAPSHNPPPSAGSARRTNYQMVGGILILNEEGVRWFEKTYGRELRKDHREDASVRMELERILTEVEGEPFGVEYVPRRDALWTNERAGSPRLPGTLSAYLFQLGLYSDALSLCEKWFNPQNPPELGGTAFDPPHRDMIA